MPDAHLLCSAAGRGKTTAAIQRILQTRRAKPFAPIWVLLPTETQIPPFRERLIDQASRQRTAFNAVAGIEYFNFPALNSWILEIFGDPQRRVDDTARFAILRRVIESRRAELTHFQPIATLPGFIRIAADFIEELKSGLITPEEFQSGVYSDKDRDLALIYADYQRFLKENSLVDRQGEAWLALAKIMSALVEVRRGKPLPQPILRQLPKQLVIDGFDQFSRVQIRLINGLASLLDHTALTFTYEAERADTAHRRFARTRADLLTDASRPEYDGLQWQTDAIPPPPSNRPDVLQALAETLFEPSRGIVQGYDPTDATHLNAVQLIEAPDRRRELGSVFARIKRLLIAGTDPDQVIIVARDPSPYLRYLNADGLQIGIPVFVARGLPLADSSVVIALTALLGLHEGKFLRRQLLDTLRNPYVQCPYLNPDQITALDQIGSALYIVRGREAWLEAVSAAIQRAGQPTEPDYESDEDTPASLDSTALVGLDTALRQTFDALTPPEQATTRQYIGWIESLIGHDAEADQDAALEQTDTNADSEPVDAVDSVPPTIPDWGLLTRAKSDSALPVIAERDTRALQCLKRALFDVVNAAQLLGDPIIAWSDFWRDLRISIDNTRIDIGDLRERAGSVLFTDVYKARGVSHPHVFVLDLSEGQFPVRAPEDPLYLDSERAAMVGQHGYALNLRAEQVDETSLFYEMVCLAQSTLTLTRSYIDDRGEEWQASPYWRAVREKMPDLPSGLAVERIPISPALAIEAAASIPDLLVTMAHTLSKPLVGDEPSGTGKPLVGGEPSGTGKPYQNGDSLSDTVIGVHTYLVNSPFADQWRRIQSARRIEHTRMSDPTPTRYNGRIESPDLLPEITARLGSDHLWSASQFNDYGMCPYRFFARRLLKLTEWEEIADGLNPRQIGIVYHQILEHVYRDLATDHVPIAASSLEAALELLAVHSTRVLDDAPMTVGFRPSRLWEQERYRIVKKLRQFIEADFSAESPLIKPFRTSGAERVTYAVEQVFGETYPLTLYDADNEPLKVRGAIDRVDRIGDALYVYDYKSGTGSISVTQMTTNRNVQMLVYLYAARHILPDSEVAGSAFIHFTKLSTSGTVITDDIFRRRKDTPGIEKMNAALEQLAMNAASARHGIYPTRPQAEGSGDALCSDHCAFYALCRAKSVAIPTRESE